MPHVYDPLRLITIGRNNLRTEKRDGHRWYGWGACSKHGRNDGFASVYAYAAWVLMELVR